MFHSHGMGGTSETHCCYKHEVKDSLQNHAASLLDDLLAVYRKGAAQNNIADMDRADAISEILHERKQQTMKRHPSAL